MTTAPAPRLPVDLTSLYDTMRADLIEHGRTASIVFGQREPAKRVNQGPGTANRICFVPGDETGKAGDENPVRMPGGNPRPLALLAEVASVYCWAKDTSASAGEREDYIAARALYAAARAAIQRAGGGNVKCLSPKWIVDTKERRYGYEIMFLVVFGTTIHDLGSPTQICNPDLGIEIDGVYP